LKILLINPHYWTGGRIPLGYMKIASIPLGLGYIAAYLDEAGFSARILDMDMLNLHPGDLNKRLAQFQPDIVGITSFSSNYKNAVDVAKAVKSYDPGIKIVMGGVHATFTHEKILKSVPEVDIVVRYEGEHALTEIAESLEGGRIPTDVLGISYRDGSRIVSTPLRERMEDLDSLPFPAYHLLDPKPEAYIGNGAVRCMPVITTRGCPFNCIFCSTASLHGRKYRVRDNSKVVDEIEYLVEKYKINNVSFVDDNFTMRKDRVEGLCSEMKKRQVPVKWGCSTRIDLLSKDLVGTMKDAGCEEIFFGIESASQKVLDTIRKDFSIEQAKQIVRMVEEMGVKTHCSFILGLPGETVESLGQILQFIDEARPSARVLPNVLDILPGTELYEKRADYFPDGVGIPFTDIVQAQVEMLYRFYSLSQKTGELFRVVPPKVIVEGCPT
jgi:anaerobic magnesium-protoporphyrin IX monomethyl ester cyclase